MSAGEARDVHGEAIPIVSRRERGRHCVLVNLNDEQMAAAEGWRLAHGMSDQSEALGELIRLGLLSEVAKIYRLVSNSRPSAASRVRQGDRKPKNAD